MMYYPKKHNNKYLKVKQYVSKFSTSLVITDMQIKTTIKYHFYTH